MFVSGTFLFVIFSIALLFLLKTFACRSFYREVQRPYRSSGWHNDPTRPDPRSVHEGGLQVLSPIEDGEERAEKAAHFLSPTKK